jgi:CubicO group peptidase (beta-lactamase class C family)
MRAALRCLAVLVALLPPLCAAAAPAPEAFEEITALAQDEIAAGRIPGAVILIGAGDRILYRRAFGVRTLTPQPLPMRIDTIFDLASLTKVVATTPAVMQLVEQGRLRLEDPIARYWPEFAANGKDAIHVRDLLTHYSGLRADLDLSGGWSGYDTAMEMIVADEPVAPPGARYLYSDLNFEVLGELVRRVSGETLDRYAGAHVFAPLAMRDTFFLPAPPPAELRERIAPSQDLPGAVHWAEVHDATARRMGGVAGHAGVFATADDMARFARMLLAGGSLDGVRILRPQSVADMTMRQSPAEAHARGYGFDLGGADGFAAAPAGSYGHLGFTGTMLWVMPERALYAVVLTHRVYPDGKGNADPLRRSVLSMLDRM